MDGKILVTYATRYGATAEIAARIGEVFGRAGLPVDVLPVDQVVDLPLYRAVVLGSAVYVGRWRQEASRFLQTNETTLAERPLWLFSSGPTGEGDPEELMNGWVIPVRLRALVDRLHPRDIAVFHGDLNPRRLNLIEKWMIKNVKAPTGDFRDWEAIAAWAKEIALVLQAEGVPAR